MKSNERIGFYCILIAILIICLITHSLSYNSGQKNGFIAGESYGNGSINIKPYYMQRYVYNYDSYSNNNKIYDNRNK